MSPLPAGGLDSMISGAFASSLLSGGWGERGRQGRAGPPLGAPPPQRRAAPLGAAGAGAKRGEIQQLPSADFYLEGARVRSPQFPLPAESSSGRRAKTPRPLPSQTCAEVLCKGSEAAKRSPKKKRKSDLACRPEGTEPRARPCAERSSCGSGEIRAIPGGKAGK